MPISKELYLSLRFENGAPLPPGLEIEHVNRKFYVIEKDNKTQVFTERALRARELKYPDGRDIPPELEVEKISGKYFVKERNGAWLQIYTIAALAYRNKKFINAPKIIQKSSSTDNEGLSYTSKKPQSVPKMEAMVHKRKKMSEDEDEEWHPCASKKSLSDQKTKVMIHKPKETSEIDRKKIAKHSQVMVNAPTLPRSAEASPTSSSSRATLESVSSRCSTGGLFSSVKKQAPLDEIEGPYCLVP